jgi:hypothetical protein
MELSAAERRLPQAVYDQSRGTTTISVYPAYLALQRDWHHERVGPLIHGLAAKGLVELTPKRTVTLTPAGIRVVEFADG